MGKRNYYYIVIVVCACAMAAASNGIFNLLAVLYAPIADAFGVGIGSTNMYYTIALLTCGFGGPVAVKLMRKISFRVLLGAGTALSVLSFVLLSRITALWQLYILAFTQGLGSAAFGAVVLVIVINSWFRKRVGLVMGIMTSSMGLLGTVFSPVLNSVTVNSGWRAAFMTLAILTLCLCLPGVIFLRRTPAEAGMTAFGDSGVNSAASEVRADRAEGQKAKIFTIPFILFMIACLMFVYASSVPGHLSKYAVDHGFTSAEGAAFVSVAMVGNVLSKLSIGIISDKFGAKKAMTLFLLITMLGLAGLVFLAPGRTVMSVLAFMCGCAFSITATGIPLASKDLFRPEAYMDSYSILSVVGMVGSAASMTVIGFMYDSFGSYAVPLGIVLLLDLGGLLLLYAAYAKRAKEN